MQLEVPQTKMHDHAGQETLSGRESFSQPSLTALFPTIRLDILKATDISEAWKPLGSHSQTLLTVWYYFQEGKVNST